MDLEKIKQIAFDEMSEKVHWSGEKGQKLYHGERVAKLALALKKYILPNDSGKHNDIMTVAAWFHDNMHGEKKSRFIRSGKSKNFIDRLLFRI